jgi:superfamily II DNA or RNA helicase/HKD family nuclease/diadenosine tetraphosphate (Ap4A) HIT family hydrolase
MVIGLWDAHPVNPGHALLVPTRHVEDWFGATIEEKAALLDAVTEARRAIEDRYKPDGFNIGVNVGRAAGQTILHLHVHVIPRYLGDMPNPAGGVRHVVPARGKPAPERPQSFRPHDRPLVAGGGDPLLPHLVAHLDDAVQVDINVAFVMESGAAILGTHLREILERGGRVRILTGDYRDATDPAGLRRLLDLHAAFPERFALRAYRTQGDSFHPKSYIIRDAYNHVTAFVGSSNLSRTALLAGAIEWNYRIVAPHDGATMDAVCRGFEELWKHARTEPVDDAWIDEYARRRGPAPVVETPVETEPALPIPKPHVVQQEALAALQKTRGAGNTAGLVVLATGLGKTWLSAFDCQLPQFNRVLFVAHREEILGQALDTYRAIRPSARLGLYTGKEKVPDSDVLFASIQTLGRERHLSKFSRTHFDYIVVDEFHHASAATYRRLIDYFKPQFLLGLTATPERTDGADLLTLCGNNLVYRCDLRRGIQLGLLSAFAYYGVPDDVDYENIPWRSNRFDPEELTNRLATRKRAANALDQLRRRGGQRSIAFCVSQRHADFMTAFLTANGLRSVAVHSGQSSAPRTHSLEKLEAGELDVVCAVDMFNEGVDLPHVDTILMLRPTESRILWQQQFGRGLRRMEGKTLRVIDYIGNHRSFLIQPRTLFEIGNSDGELRAALNALDAETLELPPGCSVTYDLEAKEILRALLREPRNSLLAYYEDFKLREGVRPQASEALSDGFNPLDARPAYGSWIGMVSTLGDLGGAQRQAFEANRDFLAAIEATEMTKCFKMLVLQALIAEDALASGLDIETLGETVARLAGRSPSLRSEFGAALGDQRQLRILLEKNPIKAWTEGKGTGGKPFFAYDGRHFGPTFSVAQDSRLALNDLTSEIAEWRIAGYLRRVSGRNPESVPQHGEPPVLWHSYVREQAPGLFGGVFDNSMRQVGIINLADRKKLLLLVTLDKAGAAKEHKYKDEFINDSIFKWQSQNRNNQSGKIGQIIGDRERFGYEIHLFVRKAKTLDGTRADYVYCGPLDFQKWEGNNPITVWWKLQNPLPPKLRVLMGLPQ